ncbi:MAG: Fic family protein [archaeon]
MKEIIYPSEELLIEYNAFAITLFDVKKADSAKVLSYSKLKESITKCKNTEGDVYYKAAVLLSELIKAHSFASGNRRTAIIATIDFVRQNKGDINIIDTPDNANILTGIREGYYVLDEIAEWFKNGKIRNFERK